MLGQIQQLHRVEARLWEHRAGAALRLVVRASENRPIVKQIERVLIKLKASERHLPQSPLGAALDYTLGLWPALEVYLADGRLEIDNNRVENAIQPTAIGKKNWLFVSDAMPENAVPSSTRSSNAAAAVALIPLPTFATCCPASPA